MPETTSRSLGPTGWAVYLGCSWTWCIGMFLPALLIRDLGLWGYIIFAVPNVIGAAAMGWVLKSPESSRKLVEDHRQAAVLFSRVTILFHQFWFAWLIFWAIDAPGFSWLAALLVVVLCFMVLSVGNFAKGYRGLHHQAIATWLVSAGLLVTLAVTESTSPSPSQALQSAPFTEDAIWLLPASAFGFLFCPYLDLTFHRARQSCESTSGSKTAFGLGFGVFFFSMILLTVLYSGPIAAITDRDPDTTASMTPWIAVYLALHLLTQFAFTTGVHRNELTQRTRSFLGTHGWLDYGCYFAYVLGIIAVAWPELPGNINEKLSMTSGEIIYRAFLTFYGLIFPTYVYLNIWNIRGRCLRTRTPRCLRVTIAAIALASPFFFMGFFVRDERYIPAGVAILLLAKLFTGSDARPAPLTRPA